MFRILVIVLVVLATCLGISVGYFNAQPIRFNYLAGEIELPLIALIIGEFILAVLLTLALCAGRMMRLRADIRRLRKQLGNAETELKNLRNIPLKDV